MSPPTLPPRASFKTNVLADRCHHGGCRDKITADSPFCSRHTYRCGKPNCHRLMTKHDQFCERHSCQITKCKARAIACHRCMNHQTCRFEGCDAFRPPWAGLEVKRFSYCEDHMPCGGQGCDKATTVHKGYCDDCICQVKGVVNPRDRYINDENRKCRARKLKCQDISTPGL